MTNVDKLRNMSDAELSQFLTRLRHNWMCLPGEDTAPACAAPTCYECWKQWLEKDGGELS